MWLVTPNQTIYSTSFEVSLFVQYFKGSNRNEDEMAEKKMPRANRKWIACGPSVSNGGASFSSSIVIRLIDVRWSKKKKVLLVTEVGFCSAHDASHFKTENRWYARRVPLNWIAFCHFHHLFARFHQFICIYCNTIHKRTANPML